jgi:tetratricopeptide (TPR) repeat protein
MPSALWGTNRFGALGDPVSALAAKRRAVALDPASYRLRADMGYHLMAVGRYQDAVSELRESLRLDPDYLPAMMALVGAYEQIGEVDSARAMSRQVLQVHSTAPEDLVAFDQLSDNEALREYRRRLLRRLEERSAGGRVPKMRLAGAYLGVGDQASALEALRQAVARHEPFLIYLATDPQFRPLASSPDLQRLIAPTGLSLPSEPSQVKTITD